MIIVYLNNEQSTTQKPNENLAREFLELFSLGEGNYSENEIKNFAKKLLSLNAFFSASGIITFKNSLELQDTFKVLPIDKILIETDSPFLAPVPNRGKKNEPSFIDYTAQKLANIKKISKSDLVNFTTNNFNKLFFN